MSLTPAVIERLIYIIRGEKVMLDADLARLYGVSTKRLNEQVKRNRDRFPKDFVFQLTKNECDSLRSQNATFSESIAKRKFLPYVFTEQGVAMLSSVLNGKEAIKVNVSIMRIFVKMRKLLASDESLIDKMERLEKGTLEFQKGVDKVFRIVFERLDEVNKSIETLEINTPLLPKDRRKIGFKKNEIEPD